jgi:hypothetical protein
LNTQEVPIPSTLKGLALLAAVVFFLHVAPIVGGFCGGPPVPMFLCFSPPLNGIAFAIAGIITLFLMWKKRDLPHSHRKARVAITLIFGLLVCDAATGGDYRWFEWSMRWQARKIQIDQFQAWTEQQINSPQQLATWDLGDFDGTKIPATLLPGFPHARIFYRMTRDGGPALQTTAGGLQGWGFIVGKSDMTKAYPQGSHGTSWSWSKQIRPGVFIYILET